MRIQSNYSEGGGEVREREEEGQRPRVTRGEWLMNGDD
jgi:hypothetical protein